MSTVQIPLESTFFTFVQGLIYDPMNSRVFKTFVKSIFIHFVPSCYYTIELAALHGWVPVANLESLPVYDVFCIINDAHKIITKSVFDRFYVCINKNNGAR